MSKIYSINDNDFIKLVNSNNSYSDCLRSLNLCPSGGTSSKLLKQRINELNISTNHFCGKSSLKRRIHRDDDIFIKHSKYKNIASMKKRIIRDKLIDYRCDMCCNVGEWAGKKLSLQLDHINGVHDDHRLSNLRFLCPNCHSQTDTYAGKNIRNDIGDKYGPKF